MKTMNTIATSAQNKMESMVAAYTAELQRKLNEKLLFIQSVAPLLERYQKNHEIFSVWRLGTEVYGSAYDYQGEPGKRGEQARACCTKLTKLVADLLELGCIAPVEWHNRKSYAGMYKFID